MANISTEQAEKFLRKIARQYTKVSTESIHHEFYRDNGISLTYTEIVSDRPRGRVVVTLDAKGEPKIISSYHIGPPAPDLHLMDRIKVAKNERRFVSKHGAHKREL